MQLKLAFKTKSVYNWRSNREKNTKKNKKNFLLFLKSVNNYQSFQNNYKMSFN